MITAYLGLGANLGLAQVTIEQAIARLALHPDIRHLRAASLYRTHPFEAQGDDYYNTVVAVDTALDAAALLALCQDIEHAFHRTRSYKNAPRTLDIDILLYGAHCIHKEGLTIPHPRLTDRAFALVPLIELDPHIEIPQKGPAIAFLKKLHFSVRAAGLPDRYDTASVLAQPETDKASAVFSPYQYIQKMGSL